MWVRFLPDAHIAKNPFVGIFCYMCIRSKAILWLYVRNRKAERAPKSVDWVASCGHDFSERWRGKSCGRFLKSEAFASGIEQIAGLHAEYGVSAIWCLEFLSVATERNSKEIPVLTYTPTIFEFPLTLCTITGKRLWFSGRTRPCQG